MQIRTRPTFSVVTRPACFRTPTCFFHAREGNVEFLGKLRDRSVVTSKLLQDAAGWPPKARRKGGESAAVTRFPARRADPLLKDMRPTLRSTTL